MDTTQTMLEEYKCLLGEVRANDDVFTRVFTLGLSALAAASSFFLSQKDLILRLSGVCLVIPIVSLLLTYFLLLQSYSSNYICYVAEICEYKINSCVQGATGYIPLTRNTMASTRNDVQNIFSRRILCYSPIFIMFIFLLVTVSMNIFQVATYPTVTISAVKSLPLIIASLKIAIYPIVTISVVKSPPLTIIALEIISNLIYFILFRFLAKKIEASLKQIKKTRAEFRKYSINARAIIK